MLGFTTKRTGLDWMATLRSAPSLTLAEAHALAAMETAAQTALLLTTLEEVKLKLVVLDKFLERAASDRGYRHEDDMRLLASGA